MNIREALKLVRIARGHLEDESVPALLLESAILHLEDRFVVGDTNAQGQAIYGAIDEDDCRSYGVPVDKMQAFAETISQFIESEIHSNAATHMGYGDVSQDTEFEGE